MLVSRLGGSPLSLSLLSPRARRPREERGASEERPSPSNLLRFQAVCVSARGGNYLPLKSGEEERDCA